MNTDKEREKILNQATNARDKLGLWDSIIDTLGILISTFPAFSLSVFICGIKGFFCARNRG
jgi:hypothetical protein